MEARKPEWLKVRRPGDGSWGAVRRALGDGGLHTVCEEARCPNRAECWGAGTATLLLLGDVCTRGCAFCSVARGTPAPPDPDEAARAARCVERLGLDYVVLTSVSRDDLPDGGASVFVRAIAALRSLPRHPDVEVLVPDYLGEPLAAVIGAGPDVLAHNVETVRRLTPLVRHWRCGYDRSLATLAEARRVAPGLRTKSSVLLGLGETPDEVRQTMRDLRGAGVGVVVLGQYLRPTRESAPVARWVAPGEFEALRCEGLALGFDAVVAAPLARSSYHARDAARGARGVFDTPPGGA
ncbi:MAG: lipoyl synthase [Deltaproteobacteria bacterium]|nr:lipoyl synthase [Deltaproteobacteria bacterium]